MDTGIVSISLHKFINDWFKEFFTGPDHPEWRDGASVAYCKGKLYYLGGEGPEPGEDTNRVDVRRLN